MNAKGSGLAASGHFRLDYPLVGIRKTKGHVACIAVNGRFAQFTGTLSTPAPQPSGFVYEHIQVLLQDDGPVGGIDDAQVAFIAGPPESPPPLDCSVPLVLFPLTYDNVSYGNFVVDDRQTR